MYTLHDDILDERKRENIGVFLMGGTGWKFGWKSNPKRDQHAFWHRHFAGHKDSSTENQYPCADELKERAPLLHLFWDELTQEVLEGHTLYRCYANAHSFGGEGMLHTDSEHEAARTSVYYAHKTWHPDWGGETMLFENDRSDIVAAIYPKPNRLLTFPGKMPHVARGLTRICPALRVTLMFKTELVA